MRTNRLLVIVIAAAVLATPAIAATSGELCAAAKLRAASRKARGLVQCHVSGLDDGGTASAGCLAKVQARFAETWARIEARGGCVTMDDEGDVETLVDTFVADLTAVLPASTTTSTTVTPTSTCPPLTALYCGVSSCGGFQAFCPSGMTCDQATCACVGPAIPCGDLHNPNYCRWGECPSGMTCTVDPGSTSCPPSCGCQ